MISSGSRDCDSTESKARGKVAHRLNVGMMTDTVFISPNLCAVTNGGLPAVKRKKEAPKSGLHWRGNIRFLYISIGHLIVVFAKGINQKIISSVTAAKTHTLSP